jgi:hypothetical protein
MRFCRSSGHIVLWNERGLVVTYSCSWMQTGVRSTSALSPWRLDVARLHRTASSVMTSVVPVCEETSGSTTASSSVVWFGGEFRLEVARVHLVRRFGDDIGSAGARGDVGLDDLEAARVLLVR